MSRAGAGQTEPEVRVSECQHCGEEFEHEHGLDERSYCSVDCFVAAVETEPRSSICKQCGKEFEHEKKERTYCSRECLAESNRSDKPNAVTSVCRECGQEFTHPRYQDRTFCSKQCHLDNNRPKSTVDDTSEIPIHAEVYNALEGHGNRAKATQLLVAAGYESEKDLREANPQDLLDIKGIARGTVSQLCRNLDYPWVTPFKRGPNPPNSETGPTPKPDEEPDTGSPDQEYEPEDDANVKVCSFCKEPVPEEKYAVHVRQCDEA